MSSAPSGRSGGVVSSAVRSGPSRTQTVKGLNAAFAAKDDAGHNRYKFQGFNARIQNIRINFRSLLEPHEIAADEQAAAARIEAATAFTAARAPVGGSGDVSNAVVVAPTEQFSSATLTTMDAAGAYSYFSASLSHLSGLQLHRDFLAFLDVMRKQGSVSSFPLLLRNQKHVVDALLSHAAVPGSQAQRELFKLISVLARDLQREFYPYMGRVMTTLLSLLDASDSDNVQAVFQTLASLFKSQARHIGADLPRFFDEYFEELLGHEKNYVRHFASETVAYLLRTLERESGVNTALPAVLRYTPSRAASEAFKDGLASTLFEVVKNTRFAFQSSHAANVAALLHLLHAPAAALDKVASGRADASTVAPAALALKEKATDYQFELQLRMHRRMANYTRRDQSKEVWSVLIKQMTKRHTQAVEMLHTVTAAPAAPAKDAAAVAAAELNESRLRALSVECSRLLQLLALWSSHRGGSRLPDHALMRRVLDMAFGPLFFAGQQRAAVEFKAQSAHMLEQYWTNFPVQFAERVKPFLDKLLSLPVTTAPMTGVAAAAAAAASKKSGAAPAAVVVDAVGVENASLMLSFLESVRNLQSGELDSLAPRIQAAAQALLLTPAANDALRPVARSLGLALLLELNGLHPGGVSGGSSYRIQALDEFHRATLTGEAARRRRRELERARLAAAGSAADAEEEEEADADELAEEGAEDVVEEEVDPAAYATPLPQPSLYACSAHMFATLRLGAPVQAWLLQQVIDALLEGQWSAAGIAAAAAADADATSGSTLLLSASSTATRSATLWSILQLLPCSGLDASAPLSSLGIALTPKQLALLRSLVPRSDEEAGAEPFPAGEAHVAEVLLALSAELGARISEAESNTQIASAVATTAPHSSGVTVFTASTPLDSTAAAADAAEDSSSSETNTHMLVGLALLDQMHFLRAQALISLAALAKHRWTRADHEKLLQAGSSDAVPALPLLVVLRPLTSLALGALRSAPTHVATLAALDKVFEMAKSAQIDGVVEPAVAESAAAAESSSGQSKSAKKKKAAAAAAPAAAASSASSSASLTEFLRALFSKRAFREQSPLFLVSVGSAHAFLRSTALSVLRYYTTLRFETADARGVAPAADDGDADADESMQPGGDDGDDEESKAKISHTSELVGDCPMLSLLHSLSVLAPTLAFEKEFVRLLKKIEVLIQSGRVPDLYMRLVPSALLGLLHLKLNPLWAHVQKVLSSSFVHRYCVTESRQQWMWTQILRPKLDEIAARTQVLLRVDEEKEEEKDEEKDDDEDMMEKHHARVAASAAAASASSAAAAAAASTLSAACVPRHSPTLLRFSHFVSLPSRSTDSFTYQSLLYTSFSLDVGSTGGKYGAGAVTNGFAQRLFNKPLIQAEVIENFLVEVWAKEYLVCFPNTNRIEEGLVCDEGQGVQADLDAADAEAEAPEGDGEEEEDFFARASSAGSSNLAVPRGYRLRPGARKLVRQKLLLFLRLFLATFHKASSGRLPRANTLRNLFLSLLTKKEEEIQKLALAALAKFQMPYLTPHLPLLQSLIAEGTWRDAMTGFNLAPEGGQVAPEHRRPFAALLIRILYPKLVQRKLVGKAGKGGSLSARRAAILSFFGGLGSSELEHLLFLVMGGHFRAIVERVVRARGEEEREHALQLLPKGKRAAAAAAAAASAASSAPKRPSAESLTFEQILDMQVPHLELPAGSRALQRALLQPSLFDSRSALRLPTSKQLGFLHMLNFFLTKLRTLSIPYLKFFVIQCSFMLLNADVQLDKYRGRMAAEAEAEAKAEEQDEAADVEMQTADAAAALADHDDDDEEDEVDEEEEDEAEENEEAEAGQEDEDAPAAADAADAKESAPLEADLGVDSDDEAPAPRKGAKKGGKSAGKKAVPHALSKYLSELREVRQLALTRMATILEQYPALFADSDEALPFPFKPLPGPSGAEVAASAAAAINSSGEEVVQRLEGPTLAPYLRFFLNLCWPSLLKLATEGTQHAGGLWGCMVHLASHHRLLVHFLAADVEVLQIGWKDEAKRVGVQLQLQSATTLKLLPVASGEGEATASPFPLFTLLQQSLGARSVHGAVVSAILSISEALLRAKEDAASWEATRAEMEEIETERREKRAAQLQRAAERRRANGNKAGGSSQMQVGRAFRDESSDEEGADSEEDVALSHRLVQIETLYLSPQAHSARVRQHFLSHYQSALARIWAVNVDAFLANMHRWISHLSVLHHASNGRGLPDQANSALVSKSLTRKAAAAAASKAKRGGRAHTSTFFPRRELEVVSSIAAFASSARTAKLLVDLLVPFLHSVEKQFLLLNLHAHNTRKAKSTRGGDLERYKPPPTLHNTLLHILLHLAPLLPIQHVEQLLEQLHRLLFSLRSNTHRALLTNLYVQLAASPAVTAAAGAAGSSAAPPSLLPLYAPIIAALNALNERRIEEYDDQRRSDAYASLDAAFEAQIVQRELALLEKAEAAEALKGEAVVAAPAPAPKLSKKAARLAAANPLLAIAAANKAEAPQTPLGIRRAALLERQAALQLSSVSTATAMAKSIGARPSPNVLDGFFSAYFSPSAAAHARALEMLRPLLFNFAHDMLDDDLSTRAWGSTMLQKLIAFLALPHPHAPAEAAPRDDVASQSADMQRALAMRDPLHILSPPSLLSGHLYPILKRALKNPVDKVRREVVQVLRALVLAFPVHHRALLVLVDPSNPDQDFLSNVVDISLPTRGRAITRLYQRVTVQDPHNPDLFHAVPERAVDASTIVQIVLPLLHHFIYDTSGSSSNVSADAPAASASGHSGTMSARMVAAKTASDNTVLEASIRLGGKLSAYLPWASYYHQVQVYLKLLRARPALERVLVRLVCAFIREWHFDVEETAAEVAERLEARSRAAKEEAKEARKVAAEQRRRERQVQGLEAAGYEEEDTVEDDAPMEDAAATQAAAAAAAASAASASGEDASPSVLLSRKIRSILTSRLLPQLHGLLTGLKVKAARGPGKSGKGNMETTYENQNELTSKSGMAGGNRLNNTLELVRVPVAMALVALLRKLPEAIFHAEFPRLLTALCLQLQHREQQARDLTRSTLLDILQLLGPYYFHFFVAELGRHLVNGYQLQVLGHVLFACLDTLVNKMRVAPGSIDHSIVPLMDLLMNDLLGEPAKQREVAAIRAATKEARVGHAQDCFQLLASVIGFPGSIHYLVDPFRLKCGESGLRLRELTLLSETLKRISTGLHHNPSVNANLPSLLVYVHNYLFKNVHESFAALFPRSQQEGKLSKQDKKATASKQNRHRKLDIVADKNPLEQIREENKARSEGRMAALQGRTVASRKAMEFILAIQSSASMQSSFERGVGKAKPSKDDTFMLVKPAPAHAYSFDAGADQGHSSNLILVFGLNLLYHCLKNKKLATNLSASSKASASAAAAAASSAASQVLVPAAGSALDAASNLARLDPFLHLIRDYCLVMGSSLGADTNAGTKSKLTKEGDKKTTRTMLAHSSSAVIHVALKCSEFLLQMPGLPSLPAYLRDLTNYMFALIHSKAAPHILSVCYSCLAGILRSADWKACGMSMEKQRLLLSFIKAEVMAPTASAATSVAFRLLQAILSRGVELPELYDFIIVVSQLLVTSEVDEVRKQCSAAVYSFLYNYKLGAGRLHTHLGYLLNQLSYPHATGRAAVIHLLHSIFSHFAPVVLEEQLEFLFLPLVVHLVNESSPPNRKALTAALGVLLSKVSSQKQMDVMRMVYGWWQEEKEKEGDDAASGGSKKKKGKKALAAASAEDEETAAVSAPRERSAQAQLLQFAALHVVSIMADLLKADFTGPQLLGRTVAGLARIVREQLAQWAAREAAAMGAQEEEQSGAANEDDTESEVGVGSSWRVLYSTLLALEKLFRHVPAPALTAHLQAHEPALFSDLLSTLTYPHTWVRTVSCRIVGFVLSAIPMAAFQPEHARQQLASTLLATPHTVFRLVRALTAQLQSPHLGDALSDQIVKNLVWVSLSANHMGGGELWEGLEGDSAQADADAAAEAEAAEVADAEQAEGAAEEEEGEEDEDVEMEDGDETAAAAAPAPSKKAAASSSSSSGKSAAVASFPKSDNRVLNWLFTRLSYMCRRDDGVKKRESIFRYFATMASSLPSGVFHCFLLQVVNPLYRAAEGQHRVEEAGLAEFARGVLELVQKQAGTAAFVAAYGHVRGQVAAVRQQRSAKKKQSAVLNPAQAAQRKQHRNDNKRTSKKRKIQMLKSQKGRAQLGIGAAVAAPSFDAEGGGSSKKQRQE